MSGPAGLALSEPNPVRRRYESTLRPQRAAATRDRIVDAGCDLLRQSSIRDWDGLTMRAVAERAEVNERTVFRHFGNERGLRDAVMQRLAERAGIDLERLRLDDVAEVAGRIFTSVSAHPPTARPVLDPTLGETAERQRNALRRAVAAEGQGWSAADCELASAMLDVLWGVPTYERAVSDWQLGHEEAIRGITWVIGLIDQAIRSGSRPSAR